MKDNQAIVVLFNHVMFNKMNFPYRDGHVICFSKEMHVKFQSEITIIKYHNGYD